MKRKTNPARLYEEVMVQLAELIRNGKFKPGDRLPPERKLVENLRVSRATVREALRVMELQNLVVSRPGSGTYIAEKSPEILISTLKQLALHDTFELRMILDPAIAGLAAQRAAPNDIAKLEKILCEQEKQIDRGESGAKADTKFHATLAEATHNRALIRLGTALIEVLAPSRDAHLQTAQRAHDSLRSHQRILDALKAHSARDAERAMIDHVRAVESLSDGELDTLPLQSLLFQTTGGR